MPPPRTPMPGVEPPEIDGMECAVVYQPVESGGTFFDFVALPDGRLGVLQGEVSGPVPEATVMEVWRTLRAGAREHSAADPGEVLGLSAVELAEANLDLRITVSYSILSLPGFRIAVSNAGQPPLLRAHPEMHPVCSRPFVARYPPHEPSLRMPTDPAQQVTTIDIELVQGDTLLWMSRGLINARDEHGDEFGLRRIASLLHARRGPEPEHLLQAVMEALVDFRCGDPTDDVTLIAIRLL